MKKGYNIYYNPEEFGVKLVESLEADLSYEFNIYLVFKDNNGNFFYAHDVGCSCPTPFEDIKSINDLVPLNKDNFKSFINNIMEDIYGLQPDQSSSFISKIRTLLF